MMPGWVSVVFGITRRSAMKSEMELRFDEIEREIAEGNHILIHRSHRSSSHE